MGMDFCWSGSASYGRFLKEMGEIAKVFGAQVRNTAEGVQYYKYYEPAYNIHNYAQVDSSKEIYSEDLRWEKDILKEALSRIDDVNKYLLQETDEKETFEEEIRMLEELFVE